MIYTLDRDVGPLELTAAGSWSLGIVSNPRARATVDCREANQVDTKEKTVVGNPCGGKPGNQGDTAESRIGVGAITIASLSPHTSIGT